MKKKVDDFLTKPLYKEISPMTISFNTAEPVTDSTEFSGKPAKGTYHVIITDVDYPAKDSSDNPLNGFKVYFQILDGTNGNQKGKKFDIMFFLPDGGTQAQAEKANAVLARFGQAVELIQPGQLQGGYDPHAAKGRNMIVEIYENKSGYIAINTYAKGCGMWHTQSAHGQTIPRDLEAAEQVASKEESPFD